VKIIASDLKSKLTFLIKFLKQKKKRFRIFSLLDIHVHILVELPPTGLELNKFKGQKYFLAFIKFSFMYVEMKVF